MEVRGGGGMKGVVGEKKERRGGEGVDATPLWRDLIRGAFFYNFFCIFFIFF